MVEQTINFIEVHQLNQIDWIHFVDVIIIVYIYNITPRMKQRKYRLVDLFLCERI